MHTDEYKHILQCPLKVYVHITECIQGVNLEFVIVDDLLHVLVIHK